MSRRPAEVRTIRINLLVLVTLIPIGICAASLYAMRAEKRLRSSAQASVTSLPQRQSQADPTTNLSLFISPATELVLGGVLAGDDPKLGYAMIDLRNGSVTLFKVGDQIKEGITLHSVYPDRVLLDIDGRILPLWFSGSASSGATSSLRKPPSSQASVKYPLDHVEVSASGTLRDAVQYSELKVSGRLRAIRVSPAQDMLAFQEFGLVPGDLIIAVNGIPIEEQQDGESVLELLGSPANGHVTIVRNGRRHDLPIGSAD